MSQLEQVMKSRKSVRAYDSTYKIEKKESQNENKKIEEKKDSNTRNNKIEKKEHF